MARDPKAVQPVDKELLGPRSRPVQERSKQTVNRILETAAVLVDEVGVFGFNTNLLAERSKIRIRTIYRYFPNKLGILIALIHHLDEDAEGPQKRFSKLSDPECDWRELIDAWIDEVVEWTRERPGARLLMGWSSNIPEIEELQDRIDERWAMMMMEALRTRGVDLPEERLYAVCRSFNETFDALTSFAAWEEENSSDEMIAEIHRMLLRYLELYLD